MSTPNTVPDHAGNESGSAELMTPTDVLSEALPRAFALHAPRPNPFNPRTTLTFSLPSASHVRLVVYDVAGRGDTV